MPRPANPNPAIKITITTTQTVRDDLDKIVDTGYFGNTRSEAVERLLAEAIRSLIREGTLVKKERIIQM